MLALSVASSAWLRMENMRAFSMYVANSRAAPERRTLARALLIPTMPNPVTTARTATVMISSMAEKPVRGVFELSFLFCIPIINGPRKNLVVQVE